VLFTSRVREDDDLDAEDRPGPLTSACPLLLPLLCFLCGGGGRGGLLRFAPVDCVRFDDGL